MRKNLLLIVTVVLALAACARTWEFRPLESFKPAGALPSASVCQPCHQAQFDSWKKTLHGDPASMEKISVVELRECGACHPDAVAHVAAPGEKRPASIAKMTKTEQNTLCGKCHYNQQIFGTSAINPHDKHALFANVGLEGRPKQIACLDCHSGHQGKSEMLRNIKAHVCFTCHKSAIVTMGIFQPINYLAFGKACQACHAVHGGSSGAQWTRMGVGFCVVCHFVGTALTN